MDQKTIEILKIILEADKPLSANEILSILNQRGFELNVKTVRACIERLNDFFKILGNGQNKISLTRNVGYFIDHPYFDKGQYRFLKDTISTNEYLTEDEKQEIIYLLEPFHFENNAPKADKKESFTTKLSTIDKAIKEKLNIKFRYVNVEFAIINGKLEKIDHYHFKGNLKGHLDTYIVSPVGIRYSEGRHYLFAEFINPKNKLKAEQRTYRIDRMVNVVTYKPNQSFPFLPDVDKDSYDNLLGHIENGFANHENEKFMDVKLAFRNDANKNFTDTLIYEKFKDVDTKFAIYDTIRSEFKDWRTVELKDFPISEGFKLWLKEQCSNVVVLSPESLRNEILEELQKAMNQYGVIK